MKNSDFIDSCKTLKNLLTQIIDSKPNSLRAEIAREALDYHDPKEFFCDLLQHGCASGMVSSLIYYHDTHAFFDTYFDEIEALREEYEESTGLSLLSSVEGDLKNWLAWFAFEETARAIVEEFGTQS